MEEDEEKETLQGRRRGYKTRHCSTATTLRIRITEEQKTETTFKGGARKRKHFNGVASGGRMMVEVLNFNGIFVEAFCVFVFFYFLLGVSGGGG